MTSVVSRRNVIGSLAATSAMPLWPLFALAASTTSHSFKFGAFEISVVSDGHMKRARAHPEKYPWVTQLFARKPAMVVAVAIASRSRPRNRALS